MSTKTILSPYELKGNISFDIKRDYLKKNGFEIIHLSDGIKCLFRECKIANLNFYESSYTDKLFRCYFDYIIKSIILKIMKIHGVKIIYTMHNKIGHDSKFPRIETRMMKKLFRYSDKIVILCDESRDVIKELMNGNYHSVESKISKIPLVSYELAYPSNSIDMRAKFGIPHDSMLFTFVGGIRRYKNIEIILEAADFLSAKSDVYFLVAGAGDEKYISELKNIAAKFTNVIIQDSFVPNDEMADLAYATDVFLFPLDIRSSLNSGACMYAFSFGRNVVCPNIGTIKELNNPICYSYDYTDADEHKARFVESCSTAYDEWKNNKELFIEKGNYLLEESRRVNSVDNIALLYLELYNSLL